jgi:AcrR family transcriptional regulator
MPSQLPTEKAIPTQARARLKRDALIRAATDNFQQCGYESTTAKTIAQCAGVATGTFYQYFHNKDDILRTIAKQRFEFLFDHVEPPTASIDNSTVTETFQRILTLIYDFHQRDPQLHQVLEHRRTCDSHLATILNDGEAILEERVLRFVQSFNVTDATTVAFNLFAMAEGLVHRHVFNPDNRSKPQNVIELGAEMLASYFIHQTRQ